MDNENSILENQTEINVPEEQGEMQEEYSENTAEIQEIDIEGELNALAGEFPYVIGADPGGVCNMERYKELRALGLSSKEALLATSRVRTPPPDNRRHLGGTIPRTVHPGYGGMSKDELVQARELFGEMSDEEIRALYRKVTK